MIALIHLVAYYFFVVLLSWCSSRSYPAVPWFLLSSLSSSFLPFTLSHPPPSFVLFPLSLFILFIPFLRLLCISSLPFSSSSFSASSFCSASACLEFISLLPFSCRPLILHAFSSVSNWLSILFYFSYYSFNFSISLIFKCLICANCVINSPSYLFSSFTSGSSFAQTIQSDPPSSALLFSALFVFSVILLNIIFHFLMNLPFTVP